RDGHVEGRVRKRYFFCESLDELEPEPEAFLTTTSRLELRRGRVDAHHPGRPCLLQPGAEVRGTAAELDDLLAGQVRKGLQLGLRDVPDAPRDLVGRPRLLGTRVRVPGVLARPGLD